MLGDEMMIERAAEALRHWPDVLAQDLEHNTATHMARAAVTAAFEGEFPDHGPHATTDPDVAAVVAILRREVTPYMSARGGSPENFIWVPIAEQIVRELRG